ncbi:MAG: DUF6427 family protein [Ferruginibacter sp.]
MTGIFRANNPSGNAILFFYAIVLKLPVFLHPGAPLQSLSDGALYKGLLNITDPVAKSFPFIYPLLCFVLLFTQAINFNKIVNGLKLHRHTNYLTGMSFLLITSLLPGMFRLSAALIVNSFIIWIWGKLSALYNNPSPKSAVFNIGLATGIAAFFYFPSVVFLVMVVFGIAIARPFRLQEWITGLVGIITPVYFFYAWLFLTGKVGSFPLPRLDLSYPGLPGNGLTYLALSLIAVGLIAGIYFVQANMRRQVVQTRKSWQSLFFYLVVALFVLLISGNSGLSSFILPAVPLAAVIAAAFFYPQRKIVPLLLHWSMVAVYIALNFF